MKAFYVVAVVQSLKLLVSLGPHLAPTPALNSHKAHSSRENTLFQTGRMKTSF